MFVRIRATAQLEFKGILRSHPFRIFVPTSILVVLGAPSLVVLAFEAREAMVAQLGVSTAALLATLLGLLAGAAALPADRTTRRRDLLLAGRLTASEYVIGKWLGITAAAFLCVALVGGVHIGHLLLRGAPRVIPLLGALFLAGIQGAIAAAVALCFATVLRAGPAFLAGFAFFLAGHAVSLVGGAGVLLLLLPGLPQLNLSAEAAFGPLPVRIFSAAVLHGFLYTVFLLVIAGPLAKWARAV